MAKQVNINGRILVLRRLSFLSDVVGPEHSISGHFIAGHIDEFLGFFEEALEQLLSASKFQ